MTNNKTFSIIASIILLIVLWLSLAACDWDLAGGGSVLGTPQPGEYVGGDLTATYGAGQLYRQLTVVAGERSDDQVSSTGGAAAP